MDNKFLFRRFFFDNQNISIEDIRLSFEIYDNNFSKKPKISLKGYGDKKYRDILGRLDIMEDGIFIVNKNLNTFKYEIYRISFLLVNLLKGNSEDYKCTYIFKNYINRLNYLICKHNDSKKLKIPLIEETININDINRIRFICNDDRERLHSISTLTSLPKIKLSSNSIKDIPFYPSNYCS